MSWIKSSNFRYLRRIDKDLHDVLKLFDSVEADSREKYALFNELKSRRDSTKLPQMVQRIRRVHDLLKSEFELDQKETRDVSQYVAALSHLIETDFQRNRSRKRLVYRDYKDLIALKHTLEAYSNNLLHQMRFVSKYETPEQFFAHLSEFEQLLAQESRIVQTEARLLPLLEAETKQLLGQENHSFDVMLVGYGSLMQAREVGKELEKTVGHAVSPAEFRLRAVPLLVFGWKRIFDKVMTRGVWETEADKQFNRVAALNIHPSPYHYFNAVGIRLTTEEFKAFVEREKNYGVLELRDVRNFVSGNQVAERCICFKSEFYQPFKEGEDDPLFKDAHPWPRRLVKDTITPAIKYYATCVAGARGLDSLLHAPGMFKVFLNTTYLYYWDKSRIYHGEITVAQLREMRERERQALRAQL